MKKIFVTLTFLFGVMLTTASAANWISIGNDTLNNEYFIDPSSVKLYKDDGEKFMFYANFKMLFSDAGRRVIGRTNWKGVSNTCVFARENNERFYTTIYTEAYDLDGKVIEYDNTPGEWQKIKEGTMFVLMYNAAYGYLR